MVALTFSVKLRVTKRETKGMNAPNEYSFQELSPSTWEDFQGLFESRGGPKNCWCMVWRNAPVRPAGLPEKEHKKACMKVRVFSGVPNGLIGYSRGTPAAWCSVAPKTTYKNLTGTLNTSTENVWSIVCFYVRKADQGQGFQRFLLHSAIEYAKSKGCTSIEAYPVERTSPSYRFMGFVDLFEEEGFSYLGEAGTRRKIYRKSLA